MSFTITSLNVEGLRHLDRVIPFLKAFNPDVITLQEAATIYIDRLKSMGYFVSFTPRVKIKQSGLEYMDGELIATKSPHASRAFHYHVPAEAILVENSKQQRKTNRQSLLIVDFEIEKTPWCVTTTHFTWTPNGEIPSVDQKNDMQKLLTFTAKLQPHILTGDFNIPRHLNELYSKLTCSYKDAIPETCLSSLDKKFHRRSNDPTRAQLFTSYMVDYIFYQPPYVISNVEQHFGLSDHSAFTAQIEQSYIRKTKPS